MSRADDFHRIWSPLPDLGLTGCVTGSEEDEDSGSSAAGCVAERSPSLSIGQGSDDDFIELTDSDEVGLSGAPGGGIGVAVRARTTGLVADEWVDVLMVTRIDGEEVGSYLAENTYLHCHDDGMGLMWDLLVRFDPNIFSTNKDLMGLDGEEVDLGVTAYDVAGSEAEDWVSVVIRFDWAE
jgi:hypothetical protein